MKVLNLIIAFVLMFVVMGAFVACEPTGEPDSSDNPEEVTPDNFITAENFRDSLAGEDYEFHPHAIVENDYPEIIFDGANIVMNTAREFKEFGIELGVHDEQMLIEYKRQSFNTYEQILRLLFDSSHGVGFSLVITDDIESEIMRDISQSYPDVVINTEQMLEDNGALFDDDGSLSAQMLTDIELLSATALIISQAVETADLVQLNERFNKEIWRLIDVSQHAEDNPERANLALSHEIAVNIIENNAAKFIIRNPFPTLIELYNPQEGFVGIGSALWQIATINLSLDVGYLPVEGATLRGVRPVEGFEFFAMCHPVTGDYAIIAANNSPATRNLTFTMRNFAKEDAVVFVWLTAGKEYDDQEYYDAYFNNTETFHPVEFGLDRYEDEFYAYEEDDDDDTLPVPYSFSYTFRPRSLTAFTTKRLTEWTMFSDYTVWDVYSEMTESW
ncbi:MAG: hypothetical protein FWH05_03565 [Oscillospiraceae bacterium]|nr:hypothetical protein [Oscillospiraceae bacterium]